VFLLSLEAFYLVRSCLVACSSSSSRAALVCQFSNVGALNAATPLRPPLLPRSPSTEPLIVQCGGGSYASCPSLPHMVIMGEAVEYSLLRLGRPSDTTSYYMYSSS
jgi:hypothetical protein